LEDVDVGADVEDADGVAGVDNVGREAGRDGWSRPCLLCRSGTVAPMQRCAASMEQWLRCRGSEDHVNADIEGVEDVDDAERRGVESLEELGFVLKVLRRQLFIDTRSYRTEAAGIRE